MIFKVVELIKTAEKHFEMLLKLLFGQNFSISSYVDQLALLSDPRFISYTIDNKMATGFDFKFYLLILRIL